MHKSITLLILVLCTFIFGLYLGTLLEKYISPKENFAIKVVRIKGAKFTSPLLYYDTPPQNGQFINGLHDSINSYVANATQKGLVNNVSVFVRFPYLSDWTVINGSEKYSPASLLKVPLMMIYYQMGGPQPSATNYSLEDVNKDGKIDLLLHFPNSLGCQAPFASLNGQTKDGQKIEGSAPVKMVSCS